MSVSETRMESSYYKRPRVFLSGQLTFCAMDFSVTPGRAGLYEMFLKAARCGSAAWNVNLCVSELWPSPFRFFHPRCSSCPLCDLCLTSRPSFGARAGCSCSPLGGESPPLHAEESGSAVFSFIG